MKARRWPCRSNVLDWKSKEVLSKFDIPMDQLRKSLGFGPEFIERMQVLSLLNGFFDPAQVIYFK